MAWRGPGASKTTHGMSARWCQALRRTAGRGRRGWEILLQAARAEVRAWPRASATIIFARGQVCVLCSVVLCCVVCVCVCVRARVCMCVGGWPSAAATQSSFTNSIIMDSIIVGGWPSAAATNFFARGQGHILKSTRCVWCVCVCVCVCV